RIEPATYKNGGERHLAVADGVEIVRIAAVARVVEGGEARVPPVAEANGERTIVGDRDADRATRDLAAEVLLIGMAARRREPEPAPAEGRHVGGHELDAARGTSGSSQMRS